jgi:hypothetical protein
MKRLSPRIFPCIVLVSTLAALADSGSFFHAEQKITPKAAPGRFDEGFATSPPVEGTIFCRLGHPVQSLALSRNLQFLAAWSNERSAHIFDIPTKKEIFTAPKTGRAIAFSPDGKLLGIGGLEKNTAVNIWSAETWKKAHEIGLATGPRAGEEVPLALAFSPCQLLLAAGCVDATIRICDLKRGKELRRLENPPFSVCALAFSADGKLLAVGSHYVGVTLWDVDSGRIVRVFHGHSGASRSVAISFDGKLLASGSFDKTIRIWQVATGEPWLTLRGHKEPVTSIALSADDRFLLSASEDRTIKLWELATGRELHSFEGHERAVRSAFLSSTGQVVVSASDDGTVRFWGIWRLGEGHQGGRQELDSLWEDLGDDDGPKVYQTLCQFLDSSIPSLRFLKSALPGAARVDTEEIRKLIRDLDDDRFSVRQRATTRLLELGALVDRPLLNALADEPSIESGRRLRRLVAKFELPTTAPAQLRVQRGLFILERIGNSEARAVVKQLATGEVDNWVRREATASLARMASK